MAPRVTDPLGEIRVADVTTFLAVCRYGSVTSAARALEVTPSQVSKSVSRLEKQLKLTLLRRNARGVTLSEAAAQVLPRFEAIVNHVRLLSEPGEAPQREILLAAPSYLLAFLLPPIVDALPQWRFRGLQLSPTAIRASITRSLFDIALGFGSDAPSDAWHSEQIGDMRVGLFGSPAVARTLEPFPVRPEAVKKLVFITPVSAQGGQIVPGNDDCPLSLHERRRGHEVETVSVGLELAARTEQVCFGPVSAAAQHLREGRLVEIPVRGWDVRETLYAFFNKDRVSARVSRELVAAARAALAGVPVPDVAMLRSVP